MPRVLIAEDDVKLQKFLRVRLKKQESELEIVLAKDAREAISVSGRWTSPFVYFEQLACSIIDELARVDEGIFRPEVSLKSFLDLIGGRT